MYSRACVRAHRRSFLAVTSQFLRRTETTGARRWDALRAARSLSSSLFPSSLLGLSLLHFPNGRIKNSARVARLPSARGFFFARTSPRSRTRIFHSVRADVFYVGAQCPARRRKAKVLIQGGDSVCAWVYELGSVSLAAINSHRLFRPPNVSLYSFRGERYLEDFKLSHGGEKR